MAAAAVESDLAKVTRDIMKAIAKRRALPSGYAVLLVIARAPDETRNLAGAMTVASVPPQDPSTVVGPMLRAAADGLTDQTIESMVPGLRRVPTGNA